jgi:hypothetical protein
VAILPLSYQYRASPDYDMRLLHLIIRMRWNVFHEQHRHDRIISVHFRFGHCQMRQLQIFIHSSISSGPSVLANVTAMEYFGTCSISWESLTNSQVRILKRSMKFGCFRPHLAVASVWFQHVIKTCVCSRLLLSTMWGVSQQISDEQIFPAQKWPLFQPWKRTF